jgi:hypothetical protein
MDTCSSVQNNQKNTEEGKKIHATARSRGRPGDLPKKCIARKVSGEKKTL